MLKYVIYVTSLGLNFLISSSYAADKSYTDEKGHIQSGLSQRLEHQYPKNVRVPELTSLPLLRVDQKDEIRLLTERVGALSEIVQKEIVKREELLISQNKKIEALEQQLISISDVNKKEITQLLKQISYFSANKPTYQKLIPTDLVLISSFGFGLLYGIYTFDPVMGLYYGAILFTVLATIRGAIIVQNAPQPQRRVPQ